MKTKLGLILAAMFSTAVLAQVDTNAPIPAPVAPAPAPLVDVMPPAATNAPATKVVAKKKKAHKKKVAATPAVVQPETPPFGTNELAEAKQGHLNVRGQPHINSEVVTHLNKGDVVTVLEEVTLKHHKTDEPARWAKILLPAGTHVWISSAFIDTNKTVLPAKLNVRSGPGENYSVLGLLHKGDVVKDVGAKDTWTEIEAPATAYAFVAAHLLAHKGAAPQPPSAPTPVAPVAAVPPPVAPTQTIVPGAQPIVPAAPEAPSAPVPVTPPPAAPPEAAVVVPPNAAVPAAPLPAPTAEEPEAERIVTREGIVRGTVSIQAPSYFELENLDEGRVIDYLYTTSPNLLIKRYKGMTILVTGEESLDERWPNTPVLTIQKIQVVQ